MSLKRPRDCTSLSCHAVVSLEGDASLFWMHSPPSSVTVLKRTVVVDGMLQCVDHADVNIETIKDRAIEVKGVMLTVYGVRVDPRTLSDIPALFVAACHPSLPLISDENLRHIRDWVQGNALRRKVVEMRGAPLRLQDLASGCATPLTTSTRRRVAFVPVPSARVAMQEALDALGREEEQLRKLREENEALRKQSEEMKEAQQAARSRMEALQSIMTEERNAASEYSRGLMQQLLAAKTELAKVAEDRDAKARHIAQLEARHLSIIQHHQAQVRALYTTSL